MPDAPLISIVVLSWNRREALRQSLREIDHETYTPREIIIVDNGSIDGSADMVRSEFPTAHLIALPRNLGVEGLNIGIRAAKGELIVLLDDDSYPRSGALSGIAQAFAADSALGIAACRVIGPPEWNANWAWPDAASGAEVTTFIGCGVGLRRSALDSAGLFDGGFFLYLNELDLSLRVINAGYSVRYYPEIVFVHALSSVNRTSLRLEYYSTRNILWVIWKYLPRGEALVLTARTVSARLLHRLGHGEFRRIWTALAGVWDAVTMRSTAGARTHVRPHVRQSLRGFLDQWYAPPWKLTLFSRSQRVRMKS